MFFLKRILSYFSKTEYTLWLCSVLLITVPFLIFSRESPLSLIASLVGVSALIFCAKGNPIGQVLVIIFSILYGIISFGFAYYGEMITYLGMTLPMAVLSLISWLRNPYKGNKAEVEVKHLRAREWVFLAVSTVAVTAVFYFILKALGTSNLIPSTVSVSTSFAAVYLTFKRSPFYAIAYALNDVVLIVLWVVATLESIEYLSVFLCFVAFLANDIYGFISWKRMEKRQMSK